MVHREFPADNPTRRPKNDDILLLGRATSFFVRYHRGHYVLEFEFIHV